MLMAQCLQAVGLSRAIDLQSRPDCIHDAPQSFHQLELALLAADKIVEARPDARLDEAPGWCELRGRGLPQRRGLLPVSRNAANHSERSRRTWTSSHPEAMRSAWRTIFQNVTQLQHTVSADAAPGRNTHFQPASFSTTSCTMRVHSPRQSVPFCASSSWTSSSARSTSSTFAHMDA